MINRWYLSLQLILRQLNLLLLGLLLEQLVLFGARQKVQSRVRVLDVLDSNVDSLADNSISFFFVVVCHNELNLDFECL